MTSDPRPAWKAIRSEGRSCLIAAVGLIGTAMALGAISKRVRELEDESAGYREDIAQGRLAWVARAQHDASARSSSHDASPGTAPEE